METNATSPLIVDIPATQLIPNAANPRKTVGDVTELAASIKAQGLQQQLLVTPAGQDTDGKPLYRIVIGHRRYQACLKAGMTMIPCTVRHLTDREEREIMLIENTQRADLTPVEEADGYQGLLDLGASIDELADKTGRSTSFVRRRITQPLQAFGGTAMSRRETRSRLERLTPTMRELLIALLNHTMLPANSNNSRTFAALEERGLIQPDFYDNWALTDEGHKTARDLLKRR